MPVVTEITLFGSIKIKTLFSTIQKNRIIRANGYSQHEKILFLGHQIPIVTTAGVETDRGLAITGKNAISSWGQKGHETTSNLFEYALKFGQWFHVATVVNRDKNQLSTFLNGVWSEPHLWMQMNYPSLG